MATTRQIQKHGLETDWNKIENFIPYLGEIIVYDPDENHAYSRLKIGNGSNLPRDLPFVDAGTVGGKDPDNIEAAKLKHKLIFGAGEAYQFDGSADVTVPVYTGSYHEHVDAGYQEDNFDDD